MSAGRLVVIGAGGHAKMLIEAARATWDDIVVVDDDPTLTGSHIVGCRIVGGCDWIGGQDCSTIVAVGSNPIRGRLLDKLSDEGSRIITIVHPMAFVSPSAELGVGVFVGAGAMVGADARLSRGTIINTAASVDHDCVIGDCAHIGPGAHLCGNVTIGARTLVGVGASAVPGVKVGDDCRIGAGAAVIGDVTNGATVVGVPARPVGALRT
jgi:sugar O-acyltransferase (sialic acid O-acetyltransferase NeuD family)